MAEQNKTGRSKNCGISNFPLSLHKSLACIQLKIFALFSSASLDLGLLIPALPSHCSHPHHLIFIFSVLVSAPFLLYLKVQQSMCLHYIHLLFFFLLCSDLRLSGFHSSCHQKGRQKSQSTLHSILACFPVLMRLITFGESPLFLASPLSASPSTFDYCFTVLQILFIISGPTRFTLSGVHFCGKKITKKPHPPTLRVIATYSA